MKLDKNTWYVKWFFWSLGICEEFLERYDLQKNALGKGTNLCFFVQCVLFYAPLIVVLNLGSYIAALAVVTVVPIYYFGFTAYLWILGVLGALIALVYLCGFRLPDYLEKRKEKKSGEKNNKQDSANPSFRKLIFAWLGAKKQKVCPTINFVNEQGVDQ